MKCKYCQSEDIDLLWEDRGAEKYECAECGATVIIMDVQEHWVSASTQEAYENAVYDADGDL